MGVFGNYLSDEGLQTLQAYKYTSGPGTVLDRLMTPWWEFCTRLMPMWVAPNVLTLAGWAATCAVFALMALYSPTLTEFAPRWVYFAVAILIFTYQTLDAVDGKQARRTGSSSPLGTLFDHGCDIVSAVMLGYCSSGFAAAGAGALQNLHSCISTQCMQFGWMWYEYHFNVFHSNTGSIPIGVTEAQWGSIVMALGAGFFGPQLYHADLRSYLPMWMSGGLPFISLARIALLALILMNSAACSHTVWCLLRRIEPKWRSTAIWQLAGFVALQACQGCFYWTSLMKLKLHAVTCYLTMSAAYAIPALRLLLASFCKRRYRTLQWPVAPYFILTIVLAYGSRGAEPAISTRTSSALVQIVLLWMIVYLMDFVWTAMRGISSHLGVRIFSIELRKTGDAMEAPKDR